MRRLRPIHRAFSALVRRELVDALRAKSIFTPNQVQEDALRLALRGETVMCVAQTGAGKTLISLLPLLERISSLPAVRDYVTPDALLLVPSNVLAAQHTAVARDLAAALSVPPVVQNLSQASCTSAEEEQSTGEKPHSGLLAISTPTEVLRRAHDGLLDMSRVGVVAVDEVDAILCSQSPYDEALSPEGVALLETIEQHREGRGGALGSVAQSTRFAGTQLQYLLTTAMLTRAHDAALAARFSKAGLSVVRQQAGANGRVGVLVPSMRQRFHYVKRDRKDATLLRVLERV